MKVSWFSKYVLRQRRLNEFELRKLLLASGNDAMALGIALRAYGWTREPQWLRLLNFIFAGVVGAGLAAFLAASLLHMSFVGLDYGVLAGSVYCTSEKTETGEVAISCRLPPEYMP